MEELESERIGEFVIKSRYPRQLSITLILLALWLLITVPAYAAPLVQDINDCNTLNQDGLTFYYQGQYPEALQKFQAALICSRQAGSRASEAPVLNNLGLVYSAQGRYDEALEAYQQALAIAREVGDRAGEGAILNSTGLVFGQQGRYAEALEMFQQALTIRREVGDRAGEGTTLNNIGGGYQTLGRYAEALEMYQQALTIRREVGDRVGEGVTLNNIGVVYWTQGRYAEALEMYQQALVIRREVGNRTGEGITLNNIGDVYRAQGRYAEALEMYQQSLAVACEVGNRSGERGTLNNIGSVYGAQGRYAEALEMYQQALAIARELGDRAGEGTTLNNIGVVYWTQGRYAEALEMFQQSLTISRKVGDRAGEGSALSNIGLVYHDRGRYAEALEMFQQSLAVARELGRRAEEGVALNNIGDVYEDQERYAEALEMYQQALAILLEVGDQTRKGVALNGIGTVHQSQGRYAEALDSLQQALVIAREVGDRTGEGITLNNIGFVYQAQGHYAEALTAYQQAMDTIEGVRTVAGSEPGRVAFIAQYADLYVRAAGLFHQQGQDEEAFLTSERGRARAFLDSLATGQVELTDNEVATLLEHEQEAYAGRLAAQDALARARALDPPDPALVADLKAQLAEAEAAYATALANIEARGDQLAALVPGRSRVLALSGVQALLDEQTTLLSYFILDDQTLAFLVTQQSLEVIAIEVSHQELSDQIYGFRTIIGNRKVEATQQWSWELYRLLIAPLSTSLQTPHLAIVPHGPLHYLPFAALQDPDTGQYLIEDYTLVTLPSASALPFIQNNIGCKSGSPLILGNPDTGDPDLAPLPFAEQEAKAIATLCGVRPLLGRAATESALREKVYQAVILHLAAHSSYNSANPLYSTIVLAPDDTNDGRLEVHEVYGLDLKNTDLVVLSACQTQLGELSAGDEMVGLTRAFFFAGTPSVVATLWSVDDEATGLLMERFYTHLQGGMGKAAALRQAQLETLDDYPDPYHWSGFVLSGDGGAMQAPDESWGPVHSGAQPGSQTPVKQGAEHLQPGIWLVLVGVLLVVLVAVLGR